MSLDKNFTAIQHYIQAIQKLSFSSSKNNTGHGEICYPYAYGYSASQFQDTLARLNLNKQQLKELASITVRVMADVEIADNTHKAEVAILL